MKNNRSPTSITAEEREERKVEEGGLDQETERKRERGYSGSDAHCSLLVF